MAPAIPVYDPDTDLVDRSAADLFIRDLAAIRRTIGTVRLTVIVPNAALVEPWPEEFLWRPLKALDVIDVWWSVYRSPEIAPWGLESLYQTANGYASRVQVTRELVADQVAWQSVQRSMFQRFIWDYQEALESQPIQGANT